ncbi:hypothetical protein ACFLSF_02980, partial [Candidatus Bipolaricaulota bacterium]
TDRIACQFTLTESLNVDTGHLNQTFHGDESLQVRIDPICGPIVGRYIKSGLCAESFSLSVPLAPQRLVDGAAA